jgi:hypothetical protein
MNPHNKSFLLGFLAGAIVMLMFAMIWNLSIPRQEVTTNETENKTSMLEPLKEIIKEPMKNPFEGITVPDITKYAANLLKYVLIGFILFYIFFAVNTKNQ